MENHPFFDFSKNNNIRTFRKNILNIILSVRWFFNCYYLNGMHCNFSVNCLLVGYVQWAMNTGQHSCQLLHMLCYVFLKIFENEIKYQIQKWTFVHKKSFKRMMLLANVWNKWTKRHQVNFVACICIIAVGLDSWMWLDPDEYSNFWRFPI